MQIVFRMAASAACTILIMKHLPTALPRARGTLAFPGEGQLTGRARNKVLLQHTP